MSRGINEIGGAPTVRAQLERILVHPEFAPAGRLCAFLRFVVEEELAGRGAEIKEYVIGVKVYRKSETYDPRTDPSVRVDAGKLRARLIDYYETEGRNDPIVISIPKGTYVPSFECREPQPVVERPAHRKPAVLAAGATLILVAAFAMSGARHLISGSGDGTPPTRLVALTSEPGEPAEPSLSPDGSMVAFSWNGNGADNFDIYVKVVDAPNALRLTSSPARDVRPAWSPDGRQIAFLRNPGPAGEAYVISALGGRERRVTACSGESVGWTADSRSLLVTDRKSTSEPFAGFVVSTETGERKQLSSPPPDSITGDYDFVASPDGRSIAFCRMVHPPVAELRLLPAGGGSPVKLTESPRYIRGLAWTPDSHSIVYSSQQSGFSALWIVGIDARAVPSLLKGLETDAVRPSLPLGQGSLDRIAYQRREEPFRLWRASVSGAKMSAAQRIVPSQRSDVLPQISPDGQWIAFPSDRAGRFDIWVSRLDGTELRDLTAETSVSSGSPRWSPDGSMIVFDAHEEGDTTKIYLIPAKGGSIRRMTAEKYEEVRPSWSADGRWIYFSSDRTGRREIWKVPATGGAAQQVTQDGGYEPFESTDGGTLYFLDHPRSSKLWRMPSGGGKPVPVLDDVHDGCWSVTEAGIYFVDASLRICRLEAGGDTICLGKVERQGPATAGLAVSRDGREIVYSQPEPVRSILMMAEGRLFR